MDLPNEPSRTVVLTGLCRAPENRSADLEDRGSAIEYLLRDFQDSWQEGQILTVEEFLSSHPEVQEEAQVIDLIYEEICLREEAGDPEAWSEIFTRFPQFREKLESLQACHKLLDPAQAPPRFPMVGEALGEFRLIELMGQSARGQVYLASQPNLANRLVVLKLTARLGREHNSLARLQHTNIVPLYLARDDQDRHLRLLCMPYLGRATLGKLLEGLARIPSAQRTAQDLVAALDSLSQGDPGARSRLPRRQAFARATYVQSICWIGACCADALEYAHERGLVHLDLKPSNILISADGQPMLLDFHLAQEPLDPQSSLPLEFGGTPAYMPPEQQAAMHALGAGLPIPFPVEGRADIYALGAVLHEALTGQMACQTPPREVRLLNPNVSVGLSDILGRCLAPNSAERFETAGQLAAELRRHLSDLPLQVVRNRSIDERWQKWRKRRPQAMARLVAFVGLLAVALACAGAVTEYCLEQRNEALVALRAAQKDLQRQAFADARATLERGSARLQRIPFWPNVERRLSDQMQLVDQARAAAEAEALGKELRHLIEQLRIILEMDNVPTAEIRKLKDACEAIWQKRDIIRSRLGEKSVSPANDLLLELAVCWTSLDVRLADSDRLPLARRQALEVLAAAENELGSQPLVAQARQTHEHALGIKPARNSLGAGWKAKTVAEHLAQGRSFLHSGELEKSAIEFELARELEPRNVWASYYCGTCAYRQKRFDDAALAFSVCIGAEPEMAAAHYSRALALEALGRREAALLDYNHALALDPNLGNALLNRGILHYWAKNYALAERDLHDALDRGMDPAAVHYNLALVQLARHDSKAALTSLGSALEANPHLQAALQMQKELQAHR